MRQKPSFEKWFFQNLAAVAVIAPVMFFILPHFLFGVGFHALAPYMLVEAGTLAAALPFLYWGISIGWSRSVWWPQLIIVGSALGAVSWITLYYAAKLRLLSPAAALGSSIALLVTLPPAIIAGYYINRKLFPDHFDRRSGA